MQSTKTLLKNGMRVHLAPFAGTEAATVLVLTNVGSRYEPDHLWGASHFVEHLMFKGTKRRPTTMDISQTLDRYGAQYNAYTGKDLTGYYVRINGDKLTIAVDLLHDMLYHSLYDAVEMEREKEVIIEEIKMYDENPVMHIDDLVEQAMFAGGTLGKEIAGTPESMRAMKREDVIAYRDQYYTPARTVIVVSGAVPENILSILEETFGQVAPATITATEFTLFTTPHTDRIRFQTKQLEQIQLAFGFYGPGRTDSDRYTATVMHTILGGMMSSRLFTEVRERRGLCYSINSGADSYADTGMFTVQSGLNANRLKEASDTIFAELRKIKENPVSASELIYAQDHLEGGLKLRLENSSSKAEFIGRQELYYGELKTIEEIIAKYRAVTADDIQKLAQKIFTPENFSLAIIGPYKSAEEIAEQITPNL